MVVVNDLAENPLVARGFYAPSVLRPSCLGRKPCRGYYVINVYTITKRNPPRGGLCVRQSYFVHIKLYNFYFMTARPEEDAGLRVKASGSTSGVAGFGVGTESKLV